MSKLKKKVGGPKTRTVPGPLEIRCPKMAFQLRTLLVIALAASASANPKNMVKECDRDLRGSAQVPYPRVPGDVGKLPATPNAGYSQAGSLGPLARGMQAWSDRALNPLQIMGATPVSDPARTIKVISSEWGVETDPALHWILMAAAGFMYSAFWAGSPAPRQGACRRFPAVDSQSCS